MSYFVCLHDAETDRWLWGQNPAEVVVAYCLSQVAAALEQVQQAVDRGLTAVGYLAYEAAPAFDSVLRVYNHQVVTSDRPQPFPLVWFGLYQQLHWLNDQGQLRQLLPSSDRGGTALAQKISWKKSSPPSSTSSTYQLGRWQPTVDQAAFRQAIAAIKQAIAQGETYQVNYTFRLNASFQGSPWGLFLDLVERRPGNYAAYIDLGRYALCSASPELFFTLAGQQICARPMKGTQPRGLTLTNDQQAAAELQRSPKNRAENLMIVDMIRNDLGRIAEIGSVSVPALFQTERYPTLWQMTSTVTARTQASWPSIMAHLFPCASITGAPKARTTAWIAELETTARQIYTGTIGYLAPQRRGQFNVAIRTVLVDRHAKQAEYGVGSGIVWDSEADQEYNECALKTQVLTPTPTAFSLLETLRWTPQGGYFLKSYHLRRLAASAVYFRFKIDLARVETALQTFAQTLKAKPHRVRLVTNQEGHCSITATVWQPPPPLLRRVKLAAAPVDTSSAFLYHKTTHRSVYNAALQQCSDCDDVVLWNEKHYITESCIANIVVPVGDKWLTPPVEHGLLAGTFRAWLIDQGRLEVAPVSQQLLRSVGQFYLISALRGWQPALLQKPA